MKCIVKFIIILSVLLLSGCGVGKFTVKQHSDAFSTDKSHTFTSENNRISTKSVAGGYHMDATGVFINPFIIKSEAGNIEMVGFNIVNKTEFNYTFGDLNSLGYIHKIIFKFPGGDLLSIPIRKQTNDESRLLSYNSGSYSSNVIETGLAVLSLQDFKRLALSTGYSCKIEGSKRSVIYDVDDIQQSFRINIGAFYAQYVME